jgi:purine-binding chemotaxis protein CheW
MRGMSNPIMNADLEQTAMYVTATVGGQLFGLPVARVQDVFVPERITPVPLAAAEVAGLINLRGRIVTMLEMRRRLGLPDDDRRPTPMAIGVEWRGESYGLLIDEIGEVLTLPAARCEPAPANLDARLAEVTAGVHRLDDGLMMVLDVDRVVDGASGASCCE